MSNRRKMRDDGFVEPIGCSCDPSVDVTRVRDVKCEFGFVEPARGGFNGPICLVRGNSHDVRAPSSL
jgi:hypothetical protein